MPQPNILYLHSHDSGRYVQPYGHNIPTPHIQALAEQGVLFRQNFCGGPTCSPSRAVLLTGQCAHSSGMIGLAHRGFSLTDYTQHIVHTLHTVGYRSTLIGVQHIAGNKETIGYDHIVPTQSAKVRHVAPSAAEFLAGQPQEPFFLSVGFSETHREFDEAGPEEDARYCLPPAPLPDTPQTRQDMATFKATARVFDQGVGQVLEALDHAGLAENTLVICTTDHGIAFPGLKCNLTDHGIGVMLIMRGPEGFTGGQVCDAMVSHVDLFPTLCELTGAAPPTWLQGTSLMPLIRGETDQIHDEVFAEVTYHAAYEPKRAVRTTRFKYIRRFEERESPVLPNCDDSISKDLWMEHSWQQRKPAVEQLYDLVFDPNEAHNLAADPAMTDVLDDMRGRLDRWMHDTNDPLLQGPVPAPKGARANDPDGISPRDPPTLL